MIILERTIWQVMLAYLQHTYPQEGCGLLAGVAPLASHLYAVENSLRSPVAYEMDGRQQLEAMIHAEDHGLDLIAAFHSHPQGPQVPSPTDVAKAYYPDLIHVIVSLRDRARPATRAFTIRDEDVHELDVFIQ